jgi:patatin-like phospholipase/acyl hydrolase
MENYAYEYATKENYDIPEHKDLQGNIIRKMHMKDLFDMFAGTSVGSIITGALVFPPETVHFEKEKEFFSTQILKIFNKHGEKLFAT